MARTCLILVPHCSKQRTSSTDLTKKQREYEEWVEDVRVKLNEPGAELERGEGVPLETVVEQIQAKFRHAREIV
jgi:hypothetical protein